MRHSGHVYMSILALVALMSFVLSGCAKGAADGGTKTIGGAGSVSSPKMDARVQALAGDQARGREADALKQAAAMKRATAP